MSARSFYVYVLASRIGGTLYIGVTNDLIRRVAQHKSKLIESFTEKYERRAASLLRTVRRSRERDQAGEATEEVESGMGNTIDRRTRSELERPLPGNRRQLEAVMPRFRRGIQYAAAVVIEPKRLGVLDRPPSRTMTVEKRNNLIAQIC
jgi:predicted GIY-YIG superfamily endonuclease